MIETNDEYLTKLLDQMDRCCFLLIDIRGKIARLVHGQSEDDKEQNEDLK